MNSKSFLFKNLDLQFKDSMPKNEHYAPERQQKMKRVVDRPLSTRQKYSQLPIDQRNTAYSDAVL